MKFLKASNLLPLILITVTSVFSAGATELLTVAPQRGGGSTGGGGAASAESCINSLIDAPQNQIGDGSIALDHFDLLGCGIPEAKSKCLMDTITTRDRVDFALKSCGVR